MRRNLRLLPLCRVLRRPFSDTRMSAQFQKITFLGTASQKPTAFRNTSALTITLDSTASPPVSRFLLVYVCCCAGIMYFKQNPSRRALYPCWLWGRYPAHAVTKSPADAHHDVHRHHLHYAYPRWPRAGLIWLATNIECFKHKTTYNNVLENVV